MTATTKPTPVLLAGRLRPREETPEEQLRRLESELRNSQTAAKEASNLPLTLGRGVVLSTQERTDAAKLAADKKRAKKKKKRDRYKRNRDARTAEAAKKRRAACYVAPDPQGRTARRQSLGVPQF